MKGIAQSYKQTRIDESFDVIVIGSGIGGLTAAALLAKHAGKKVLVLERHYTAGGFTHVFKRPGYEWDVGLHYVGEVHRPRSEMRLLFDDITDGQLEWTRMPDVYDRIRIGDRWYDFVTGEERFRERMKEYFPQEAAAIDAYVEAVNACARAARFYFLQKALPSWLARIVGPLLGARFYRYSDRTTREVLEELTSNQELIAVLTSQWGDYGLTPSESSFAIHAMVAKHFFDGGNYPVGGAARIAETIAPVIGRAGGRILVNAEVDEILVEGNRAVGVRMADGRELRAGQVISDAGVVNTYGRLLPREIANRHRLTEVLEKVDPSVAHVCLYVGLEQTAEELGLESSNLWIYSGNDHEGRVAAYLEDSTKPLPVVYISFPSAKDPTFTERYPGHATIEVISLAPYQWFAPWADRRWRHRGEDYDRLKNGFSERLLEALYENVPQVRGKVAFAELSTPLSTQHFANYTKGELYGLDHSPKRFRQHALRAQTPIRNLWLTGQDVVSAGIGGALLGGMVTVAAMLRTDPLSLIRRERKKSTPRTPLAHEGGVAERAA